MSTESNSLRYSCTKTAANGVQFRIDIRLDDQCKNGHQDFSITGESWEANKPKIDRYSNGSGAIGDEIAKHFPEFKIFNDLHLCDWKGTHMHCLANGLYHMRQGKYEWAKNTLRCTESEYQALQMAEDENHLALMLIEMGIKARWEQEAKHAIEVLEGLTGVKFLCDSRREMWTATPEKLEQARQNLESGYYKPEQVEARAQAAKVDAIEKQRAKILADYGKAIAKATAEKDLELAILDAGFTKENIIHYTHIDTLTFNWYEGSPKVSKEAQATIENALRPLFPSMKFEDANKGR